MRRSSWRRTLRPRDDAVAIYDPLEAVEDIAGSTGIDPRTVADVLEGELDYLGCLGVFDTALLDEPARDALEQMRDENADLLASSDGEYDLDAAVSFIQRNRGISRHTIVRVLRANLEYIERHGLLDEDWEAGVHARALVPPRTGKP